MASGKLLSFRGKINVLKIRTIDKRNVHGRRNTSTSDRITAGLENINRSITYCICEKSNSLSKNNNTVKNPSTSSQSIQSDNNRK